MVPWGQYLRCGSLLDGPAVRRPNATLAVDREKAHAFGAALRPLLTLADRNGNGSNNGRGGHEHEKSDGDEQIVHGTDHPIHLVYRLRSAGKQPKPRRATRALDVAVTLSSYLSYRFREKNGKGFGRTMRSNGLQRKS